MLSRAALRGFSGRLGAAPLARASPSAALRIRSYAKNQKPQNNQQQKGAQPLKSSKPKDNTWKPSDPINFAKSAESSQSPDFSKEQAEVDPAATPERNNAPSSSPTGKPLPDLRQGIPSTFDMEFGGLGKEKEGEKERREKQKGEESTGEESEPSSEESVKEDMPKSAYETSLDKRRNKLANYAYIATGVGLLLGAVYFGRNWESEEEEKAHPDAPNGWGLKQWYDRINARVNSQLGYYTEPTFPKLLPDIPERPPYTLVLSLEDLLIHSEWTREHGWRTAKRPGLDYFLRYLSQYYELVIFTSLPFTSADPIIRKLDPFRIVMWPLFREATRYEKGEYIKDLSYLNRDLSKVILIDTKPEHAKLQRENAIILPKWDGKPGDKGLVALIPFLEYVATMGINDVREVLKSFEGTDIPVEFAKREAKAREVFQKQLEEERAKRPKRSAGGLLMNALGLKPHGMAVDGGETLAEGLEKGKMLSDQIRERGMKNYEMMEKEIRENGERWLKEMAAEEKRMQEETMKSMKSGLTGFFGKPSAS